MTLEYIGGLIFFAGAVLLATAVSGRYRVQSPAVQWFVVVAGTAGAGGIATGSAMLFSQFVLTSFFIIILALVLPIPWLLFSFDYTGKEEFVTTTVAVLAASPVLLGTLATALNFGRQLVPGFTLQPGESVSMAVFLSMLTILQFSGLLYAGGLMLVGSGLILWTYQRYPHLDSATGIGLVTFGTVPWISIFFGLQIRSESFLAYTAVVAMGLSVGALAAVALLGPSQLFGRVPAAGNIGPRTIIEELQHIVLVTDGNGIIVELNNLAEETFGENTVGDRVDAVLTVGLESLREESVVGLRLNTGRVLYEPTISPLTDQHGQLLGYAVVLRDVTERVTRQQRLEVINRLLRHNLRNDMSVIWGMGQNIQDVTDDEDVLRSANKIMERGDKLVGMSEKVGHIQKILDIEPADHERTPIAPLVEDIFDSYEGEYDCEFEYDGPTNVAVPMTASQLNAVVENLVENAVIHNESDVPTVCVRVRYEPDQPYPLELSVIDNGPGIPEMERQAIESGRETALQHSSGVGFWVVQWITTSIGGDIAFTERDSGGTVVTLSLPDAHIADSDSDGE